MSDLWRSLVEIAQLALRRHAEALARQPKRGATAYLRAALRTANHMARLSKTYPELLPASLEIVEQVARDARAAEASIFARGGNSSTYLGVLAAAEAARLTLLEKARRLAESQTSQPAQSSAAQPMRRTVSPPAPPHHLRPTPDASPKTRLHPTHQPPHYRKASGVKLKAS